MVERLALEALGVSKRYGDREALSRVDLVVPPGRLHGLLGPNGAGKTTLLRILLGLVRHDAGSVHLFGRHFDPGAGPIPDGVAGFVETPFFYPYLSGRQNLALLTRLDAKNRWTEKAMVVDALAQVGLVAQADLAVASYSAGMRQRLGLAAALLRTPRLLLLDEPTSSLDPLGAHDVRTLVARLAHQGAAVVLSSHDMAEVEEICVALTIIVRGYVVFSGTVDELRRLAPVPVHALRTSDDAAAVVMAAEEFGVKVALAAGGGLDVSAHGDALDAYVIALGCAGIAVRSLESRAASLKSVFLQLTEGGVVREAPASASHDATDHQRSSPAAP